MMLTVIDVACVAIVVVCVVLALLVGDDKDDVKQPGDLSPSDALGALTSDKRSYGAERRAR